MKKVLQSAVVRASPISISCVRVPSLNKITKPGATNNMYTACITLLRVQHNDVTPGKACSVSISDVPKKVVSPNASFSATSSFWFRQIQGSEYKLENVCQNWAVCVPAKKKEKSVDLWKDPNFTLWHTQAKPPWSANQMQTTSVWNVLRLQKWYHEMHILSLRERQNQPQFLKLQTYTKLQEINSSLAGTSQQIILTHGTPTCDPPGFIMLPANTFAYCVYTKLIRVI